MSRQRMIGTVQSVAKGGEGLLFHEGQPVFIPGVLAGELVEFFLTERCRGVAQAKLEKVLEPSPDRVNPPCIHYSDCGGCNFQHIAYPCQLEYKKQILLDCLKRIGRVTVPPGCEVIPSPPFHYRSRSEFQVKGGRIGFFRKKSRDVIPISDCRIVPQIVQEFILSLQAEMKPSVNGQLSILSDGESLSALMTAGGANSFLSTRHDIVFPVAGYSYRATPANFLQANRFLIGKTIELFESEIVGISPSISCDLFCGIGFFTLPLARRSSHVFALENNEENLRSLRENLQMNRIKGVQISSDDIYRQGIPASDLYVADPPRVGLGAKLVAAIADAAPETVILFSCDAATFSRDLRDFHQRGYHPHMLKLIDNFPQTDHFEIFSLLKKQT